MQTIQIKYDDFEIAQTLVIKHDMFKRARNINMKNYQKEYIDRMIETDFYIYCREFFDNVSPEQKQFFYNGFTVTEILDVANAYLSITKLCAELEQDLKQKNDNNNKKVKL